MSAAYRTAPPIATLHDTFAQPVSALCFDPVSDSIWAGTETGTVVALHSIQGIRGVSFPVGGGHPVRHISVGNNFVRAYGVAGVGVGSWAKGGMNKWFYQPTASLAAVSNNTYATNVIAASTEDQHVLLLNSMTGAALRQAATSSVVTHLQFSSSALLAASRDGFIRVHDPRSGMRREDGESLIQPHTTGIEDIQTSGNYLFTIGWSMRRGHAFPDPLVKMYDIRNMRPLPPIPFSDGPAFINVLPKQSSSLIITSNQGLVNVVDVSDVANASSFNQLETGSYITSTAVSSNGSYVAFGDASGAIHLLTATEENGDQETELFNGFEGQPAEWADVPEPVPEITWTDETPLNTIGMPYYNELLLSSWTPALATSPCPPPTKIPPQILSTMKTNDNVAYAALPKELRGRRNRVVQTQTREARFRSDKRRNESIDMESLSLDDSAEEVPRLYRKVEIEYSKFGVEDFDFGFYNKTPYSGLETHILNSYTNALVQVLNYSPTVARLGRSHITTNCPREQCLLCELGFVVRMLEDARGTNCQSSNFCRAVGLLAHAQNQLELIDYGGEPNEIDYAHKIQAFHRFLVDHLCLEGNAFPHNPEIVKPSNSPFQSELHSPTQSPAAAPITQLLGVDAKNVVVCTNCKAVREKENMTHVVDMIYPRKPLPNEPIPATDFAGILQSSLVRQLSYKATCQTCKSFATFLSQRSIPTRDLPPVLAVNASVYGEDSLRFWMGGPNGEPAGAWGRARNEGVGRGRRFLEERVEICGHVEGVDDPDTVEYELRGMVVQITAKDKSSHLIAIVKVPDARSESPWYVFNDFVVRNVSEDEALSFPGAWKVPSILYLERVDIRPKLDFSGLPDGLDPSILCQDTNISINRDQSLIQHECLRFEELPTPGTLVAIDAEFVSMQQEEIEYRSDGTNRVLRPARLSLARVSVLREGGVPFIDDHIHTSEAIVDYLTEFSGIRYGDLDPRLSRHTLTPLKVVYKKLRLLVDRGCIFIGHGLSKDFRIINIFVPPEQVIDTVDLYFLRSRQRRLSLRFLAWIMLNIRIQGIEHDSVEDARTALSLFQAYQELEGRGEFDRKLDEIYREGKATGWRPPPVEGAPSSPPIGSPAVGSGLAGAMTPTTSPQRGGTPHGTPQGSFVGGTGSGAVSGGVVLGRTPGLRALQAQAGFPSAGQQIGHSRVFGSGGFGPGQGGGVFGGGQGMQGSFVAPGQQIPVMGALHGAFAGFNANFGPGGGGVFGNGWGGSEDGGSGRR